MSYEQWIAKFFAEETFYIFRNDFNLAFSGLQREGILKVKGKPPLLVSRRSKQIFDFNRAVSLSYTAIDETYLGREPLHISKSIPAQHNGFVLSSASGPKLLANKVPAAVDMMALSPYPYPIHPMGIPGELRLFSDVYYFLVGRNAALAGNFGSLQELAEEAKTWFFPLPEG